jgi:hypothetical protein
MGASLKGVERQRLARAREIVSGKERRLTRGTQVVRDAVVGNATAGGPGTFESRKRGQHGPAV